MITITLPNWAVILIFIYFLLNSVILFLDFWISYLKWKIKKAEEEIAHHFYVPHINSTEDKCKYCGKSELLHQTHHAK